MPKDDTKQAANIPPVIFTEDVLPPMPNLSSSTATPSDTTQANDVTPPPTTVVEPKVDITTPSPVNTDTGSAAPTNDVITDTVMPAVVTSSPKKKFAGGKVIATILGLFLLVGGLGAGIFLTQQNQNIAEKASEPVSPVDREYLNAPQADHTLDTTTDTYLGVENVTANPTIPSNQEIRCTGRICRVYEIGTNIAVGGEFRVIGENTSNDTTTTTTTTETASCQNIKAYSTNNWTLLTPTVLSTLTAGDSVNFCATGTATGGSFDKAKFTINGVLQAETTATRPGGSDFCQLYVIPASTTTFNVTAQIHHVSLGWK